MMYKEFSMDKRIEYVNALIDMVDRDRNRHHLVLPLLTSTDDVEERLKLIFRCANMGYKDLSELDISVLSPVLLQPLYDRQRTARGDQSKLNKIARILKSFGIASDSVWQTMYSWWQDKTASEKRMADLADASRPLSGELKEWLKLQYTATFELEKKNSLKGLPVRITYERLKKFVDDRDSSKVHAFLSSYGWPEDTNFEEIIPDVLGLYLDHEEWSNVKKMLISLSAQSAKWQKPDDPTYSPMKNYHLLHILRRMSNEGEEISVVKIINYAYELRRLFPEGLFLIQRQSKLAVMKIFAATANYDTFFNTLHEYNRLFGKCFERLPNPSVEKIDECIDLLRTLIKLEILQLHPNETLTSVFIGNVLRRLGWEEAVNTWMKFQSGLYCSNGIVTLLRFCLSQKTEASKRNIQYGKFSLLFPSP
ncbi:unnamed protein product [Cylicostephanus goldi]|uniref:Uncharacterized protein n=1 Tax=Cylicostephanus goldi TaxID=71465 RepID=A0A3P6QDU3_CYLGO|nr:unnamed protein product [Cylicostephanus goldi]